MCVLVAFVEAERHDGKLSQRPEMARVERLSIIPEVLERSHVLRITVSEEKSCWLSGLEFFAALGAFVQVGVPEQGVPLRSEWHTHAYGEW